MQTHTQLVSKQQPPWKMVSHPLLLPPPSPSSSLLFFKPSMICQGMEHLWSVPVSCCVPSQLLAHLKPTHCRRQLRNGVKRERLGNGQLLFGNSQTNGRKSRTAPNGLPWRKLTPSRSDPVQLCSSSGSKQAGPFPVRSRFQWWVLVLLHPQWGSVGCAHVQAPLIVYAVRIQKIFKLILICHPCIIQHVRLYLLNIWQ